MKVILLLSNPCVSDPRVEFIAETLAGMGMDAEILAWDRTGSNPVIEKRRNYTIRRLYIKSAFGMGLKQLFILPLFYFKAFIYVLRQQTCRAVHCNDLDTMPLGILLKLFKRIKVVYDAHEIYSDMVFDRHKYLRKLCICFDRFLEKRADVFITVGTVRQDWYARNNFSRTPILLGNWKKKPDADLDREKEKVLLGISGKIIILYIGSFNKDRNLTELIDAVVRDDRYFLILGGEGRQKELLLEKIKNSGNIKFIGYVRDQGTMEYYNKLCDVIYYGMNMDALIAKTAVPNKMFEAIAYNKLFLGSPAGEISELQKINHAFVLITDLKQQLDDIHAFLSDENKRYGLTLKNQYLYERFCEDKAVRIIRDVYKELLDLTVL